MSAIPLTVPGSPVAWKLPERGPVAMYSLIVAESGIETPDDIRRLDHAGARAFLIGESLLRGGDPRAALTRLARSIDSAERNG